MKAPTLSYRPTPCRGAGRRFLTLAATGVLLSGIILPFGPLETWTDHLNDGWGSHHILHYVTVNGNNDNLAEIEYFDSANDNAAYGAHVVGFHYELKSGFQYWITDTVW